MTVGTSKPSPAQNRAVDKLNDTWQSSVDLKESLTVLDALVKRGLANVRYEPGSLHFPSANILYRLA
jgi:hypothetical protein